MIAEAENRPSPSDSARGILFVVSGPSGAGKSTLVSAVVAGDPLLRYCSSFTTRPQRPGEVNGLDYCFVSRAQFAEMVRSGQLFEHATVYGFQYGRSKELILNSLKSGGDVIMNVDVQGAAAIRGVLPESVSIFIMPPSMEVLRHRLQARGTEISTKLKQRLRIASEEIRRYPEFDYLIVNDALDAAPRALEAIVRTERHKRDGTAEVSEDLRMLAERHRREAMSQTTGKILETFRP